MNLGVKGAQLTATKYSYAGLFLVTQATLMYEILLTRIFSVTMWYHFAFMAISIAMFGMTAGAVLVYFFPDYFKPERTNQHLGLFSLLFAISTVISFCIDLRIPFITNDQLRIVSFTYLVTAIPFVFSGICVSLALTRFPMQLSKLYAADLAGAAFGCVALIFSLRITDGPTTVLILTLLAAVASMLFLLEVTSHGLLKIAFACCILLGIVTVTQFGSDLMKLRWAKGVVESEPLYEEWNSYSRVRVVEDSGPQRIFGWGLSPTLSPIQTVKELKLDIDAGAATVLTQFDGDLKKLNFLKYDVTNMVHYIRPESSVLVIGAGGSRDILSALVFEQNNVVGVEMNTDVLKAVNVNFADFTGHLYKHPKVKFVNEEARSHVAWQKEKFDIIQASLIDTYAATAAGAFVLSENSLYTLEAWKIFLTHLKPNGVLTFSRWYFPLPGQVYRLTSIATAALMELGIKQPRDYIIVVVGGQSQGVPMGTILVSNTPFSDKDLSIIKNVTEELQFRTVLSPKYSIDPIFEAIASGTKFDSLAEDFPLDISPPTDDRPFFFYMQKAKDAFTTDVPEQGEDALFVLGTLLILVIVLTSVCIFVPLFIKTKNQKTKGSGLLILYFAAIGFGFLLIEISQMQRLTIFLGHPTYSLSVMLFALLLSSGIGSYLTQNIQIARLKSSAFRRFVFLLAALVFLGFLTPYVPRFFQGYSNGIRIFIAILLLFPAGLFMGMLFPIGMKMAYGDREPIKPWLWGINGATSVCASVLAIVIALTFGISAAYWSGVAFYIIACVALLTTSPPLEVPAWEEL
jgi:SAM-dependent methyltransferase